MNATTDHAEILGRLLPPVSYAPAQAALAAELRSAAAVLDEAWASALRLRVELDPRSAYDLLEEFEQAYGVPDLCADIELTVADRRLAVLAKITELGGQTPAYFEGLAKALGYADARVVEYLPMTCVDPCMSAVSGDGWRNAFAIASSDATRVTSLECTGPCTEPLLSWGLIEPLQCAMNRLKPAHTICYFDFGS